MNVIKQVGSSAKQSAKQTAKQFARQLAQEPLEILKTATRQVGVTPEASQDRERQAQTQEQGDQGGDSSQTPAEKQKNAIRSQRLMQAYENELKEIEQKKKQEELQENQAEIIQAQEKAQYENQKKESILQVVSKKGRRMFGKIGLKREQNKTETRQPPSA